ncbi:helix-turn-helix domain-containing protein [Pseudanabaena sp. Chao 1811]
MDDDAKLALQLLAEQIKKRRKILGLSQEKLAEKCGFDRALVS